MGKPFDPASTPARSSSASGSPTPRSALIEKGRILTVNIRDYTVDARTELSFKLKFDIPFMVPYCHQAQGEGINFMPEVGSVCWICTPSAEGQEAFILGWAIANEGGSYRAGRELLNPGDIHFSTRDGNFVTLRRGGVVQIGATPVCQRIYIPIRNIIQDLAENYELRTPAGDLTWTVARSEDDGDGHQKCLYTLACKEFSDDPNADPIAVMKIGSNAGGAEDIFVLQTRDSGGGAVQTTLSITKQGTITWTVEKIVTFDFKDDFILNVGKIMIVTSVGDMNLTSGTVLSAKAPSISLAAGSAGFSSDGSVTKLTGTDVALGDADSKVVIDSPEFRDWVTKVTAVINGPAGTPATKIPLKIPNYASGKVKA